MTQDIIHALVVEDSEPDYVLLQDQLDRQGLHAQCMRVETEQEMLAALSQRQWDLVISDHELPQFSSFEALRVLRQHDPFMPFLIVSGQIGEDMAVQALHAGADDYLIKGRLARLGPAIGRALAQARLRRERDAAEQALTESKQQLHELSAHLQSSIEAERQAISREIHDDVGSALTALRFDLEWFARNGDASFAARSQQAMEMLEQAHAACQRIMRNLRPPILEAGLVPALQWLCAQFRQRHAMELNFRTNREAMVLPDEAQLVIFRTVQEALTNVAKHSGATRVTVDVVQRGNELSVEVADNGTGFVDADRIKPGSFGLRGLAERARALGGWLDVSQSSHGCVLLLTLTSSPEAP